MGVDGCVKDEEGVGKKITHLGKLHFFLSVWNIFSKTIFLPRHIRKLSDRVFISDDLKSKL